MKKILSAMLACLCIALAASAQNDATEENPIDKTGYITNPSFENETQGWTNSSLQHQGNDSFDKAGSYYMEKWTSKGNSVGSASIKQTLKNLPSGVYKLTATAQNYSQDNETKKNTGAYIFAGNEKEPVYTPGEYAVKFTHVSGDIEIGFTATNASGNWIAVDNFQLFLIGDVDAALVAAELKRYTIEAEDLMAKEMSSTASSALQTAIDAAKLITEESGSEDMQTAMANLLNAIDSAKEAIETYTSLSTLIGTATGLTENKMNASTAQALALALETAKSITTSSTDAEIASAIAALTSSIDEAKTSAEAYKSLDEQIAANEKEYDESKEGAADLKAATDEAKSMIDKAEATNDEVLAEVAKLQKALLAFNLTNSTKGTGIAVEVKETNHYVPTGATQALMRATYAGSFAIEKGVCWSTEHEPTVLDSRTTKSFSLNGLIIHITGLQPATVYYLRPYVMNKTYEVAYGDEVKIVTQPRGTATFSWDEAGPDDATNNRCRNAMRETIDYFNEWTGIKGFHLSGHYVPGAGSGSGTADCSYGGYMRISQNTANQAIGTVLHETGHGVGVGTQSRWSDENVHSWLWFGREANTVLRFLENKESAQFVGDATHGWGQDASYDWLVNGSDKDKHLELQYIGGMCIMHGLFIDGLDPTSSGWWYTDHNGIAGYTYNFDDSKKYYIMCKDSERGLNTGLLYQRTATGAGWKDMIDDNAEISDSAAWVMTFNPSTCLYSFKNAATGSYLTHSNGGSNVTMKKMSSSPSATEGFQLMPDRTDVELVKDNKKTKTHGYWFTWTVSNGNFKSMGANAIGALKYGSVTQANFDYADTATKQQWIILSEDEMQSIFNVSTTPTSIENVPESAQPTKSVVGIYTTGGSKLSKTQKGLNIKRYNDGTTTKIYVK